MTKHQLQLPFEDDYEATPANDNYPAKNQWAARFAEFHDANPLVYELVKAPLMYLNGQKSFSMTSIFERSAGTQQSRHLVKSSKSTRISFLTTRECSWPTTQHDGFFSIRALGRKGARK